MTSHSKGEGVCTVVTKCDKWGGGGREGVTSHKDVYKSSSYLNIFKENKNHSNFYNTQPRATDMKMRFQIFFTNIIKVFYL